MEISQYLNQMQNIANSNNAWSAEQARNQMDFQKMMSDTAHQREVADLKAAGLNPVLSAGGSGAASATGAMGQADTSMVAALGNIVNELVGAENARAVAEMNNSAALLRQQQSDQAAMDRVVMQAKLKAALSGSSGSSGSSSGKGSSGSSGSSASTLNGVNLDPDNPLSGVFQLTDGFFESLPEKGSTKLFGVTLPNSTWKYLYGVFGDGLEKFVTSKTVSDILYYAENGISDASVSARKAEEPKGNATKAITKAINTSAKAVSKAVKSANKAVKTITTAVKINSKPNAGSKVGGATGSSNKNKASTKLNRVR